MYRNPFPDKFDMIQAWLTVLTYGLAVVFLIWAFIAMLMGFSRVDCLTLVGIGIGFAVITGKA